MFLVNSRLGQFTAADEFNRRHPFSRSYGVILPSSLTTFLSLALGFSPHLPVSVCGTGILPIHRTFLVSKHRVLHYLPLPRLRHGFPLPCSDYPSVSPLHLNDFRWYRNLYRLSIIYAFRAGQNLPDKEFRYLRTVIVTAAVHWGFGSMLRLR